MSPHRSTHGHDVPHSDPKEESTLHRAESIGGPHSCIHCIRRLRVLLRVPSLLRCSFLLALLLAGAASAPQARAQTPPGVRQVTSVEGITEYRLDNGLRLLLFPDNARPTVTVNLTVLVGSRNEGYGETGMAHLLEHMVFKGTPTHAHIPKELTEHGATYNGST